MIVRILNAGQYRLDEASAKALEAFDADLYAAIEAGDEAGFAAVLANAVSLVQRDGVPLDDETLVPSDLTLPHPDATLEEVRELLSSDDSQEA